MKNAQNTPNKVGRRRFWQRGVRRTAESFLLRNSGLAGTRGRSALSHKTPILHHRRHSADQSNLTDIQKICNKIWNFDRISAHVLRFPLKCGLRSIILSWNPANFNCEINWRRYYQYNTLVLYLQIYRSASSRRIIALHFEICCKYFENITNILKSPRMVLESSECALKWGFRRKKSALIQL